MKTSGKPLFIISCFCGLFLTTYAQINTSKRINFKENLGQVSDQNHKPQSRVLFSGNSGNLVFHLKTNGISYQLNRIDSWKKTEDLKTKVSYKMPDQRTIYRVDVGWVNANPKPRVEKEEALAGYDNYYLPACLAGVTFVKSFGRITYNQIYRGINMVWYEKNGNLEYDYQVEPSADHTQIQLQIDGATELSLTSKGELRITTPLGEIIEEAPLVKQGGRTLPARWKLVGNIASFEIEGINAALPFIIDPVVRVWGTYYGQTSYAGGNTSDNLRNIYMSGSTSSAATNLIATSGSHQTVMGGDVDAYLVKFDPSGARLWASYYGGSGIDDGTSCAADLSGNIYMVGSTNSYSGSAISTAGSHQSSFGNSIGAATDAYLVKFNSSGIRQWATYYGGTGSENPASCTCDKTGNVFICGGTSSSNGTSIASAGAHQSVFGGVYDGFLVKFNSSGFRQWATYYGGNGSDGINSCTTDSTGNVLVSGSTGTSASSVISTPGSFQPNLNSSGSNDIFLVKFNASGIRQWGTYYGGPGYDNSSSCCVDKFGNIYITGTASSHTGMTTPGAFEPNLTTGSDAYLAKFDNMGMLQWGTYYGGGCNGYFCIIDGYGNIIFGGMTVNSGGIATIATVGSHQTSIGGSTDGFIAKFNPSGTRVWGSYYGGWDIEVPSNCTIDNSGNIYLCGISQTFGDTSIATPGSYQSSLLVDSLTPSAYYNAFLVKFKDTDEQITRVNTIPNDTQLEIYPNPACDEIFIKMDELTGNAWRRIECIDPWGRVTEVRNVDVINTGIRIRTNEFKAGVYTLRLVKNNSETVTGKFIAMDKN